MDTGDCTYLEYAVHCDSALTGCTPVLEGGAPHAVVVPRLYAAENCRQLCMLDADCEGVTVHRAHPQRRVHTPAGGRNRGSAVPRRCFRQLPVVLPVA